MSVISESEYVKIYPVHPYEFAEKADNPSWHSIGLNDSSLLQGNITSEKINNWLEAIPRHVEYLNKIKLGAIDYVKANNVFFNLEDIVDCMSPEIAAIAEIKGIYLNEIVELIESGLRERLTASESEFRKMVNWIEDYAKYPYEKMSVNGEDAIAIPIPGFEHYVEVVKAFTSGKSFAKTQKNDKEFTENKNAAEPINKNTAATEKDLEQKQLLMEWIKSIEQDMNMYNNPFICAGVKNVIDTKRSAFFSRRTNSVNIVIDVTGIQYEGRDAFIEKLTDRESISIVREPNNKYNSNNLRVNNKNGNSLGNIPADLGDIISPMIDSGFAHIENGKVNFVVPKSKRGPKAKKGLLYVEFDLYMNC